MLKKNDYLTQLGAGAPVTPTAAHKALADEIRKVPYLDFCEVSPVKKMGFDGFLDENGSFVRFAFTCTIQELVTLAGNLQEHYGRIVGTSYAQLAMSLYLAAACKFANSDQLAVALWATEWLGRIVHEGSSLGGYKPATKIYHEGIEQAVRAKAVLAVWDEKVDDQLVERLEWYRNWDFAQDEAPAHAELLGGAEALVVCVKHGLGVVITAEQATWLLVIKRVLVCQGDLERRKREPRYLDVPLFAGTIGEFAALAGMLRRASKGIQIAEHAVQADTFAEGAEDTLLVDRVDDAVIKKFLGADTVIAKVALVTKNVHTSLAAARRLVEEDDHQI